MRNRSVARWCALAGLAAVVAAAAPASSAPTPSPPDPAPPGGALPPCPPAAAPGGPPTGPAGPDAPGACRAVRTTESAVRPETLRLTPAGYHHLGAGTDGEWSGVSGRIAVVDGAVRPGTYDFVAGRFMVKRDRGRGDIAWLEAGWAETGWAGRGRQHVYTFNTNTRTWQFHDRYALRPGDTVWLDLHHAGDGVWQAWLWWGERWNLLTEQRLPLGASAHVEQYVEVHVDAGRAGRIDVPPVTVDNVQLRPADGGPARYWRDDVATLVGDGSERRGGFCLTWLTRYDTWRAGDCPPAVGEMLGLDPPDQPDGDAAVVGG